MHELDKVLSIVYNKKQYTRKFNYYNQTIDHFQVLRKAALRLKSIQQPSNDHLVLCNKMLQIKHESASQIKIANAQILDNL